MKNNYTKNTKIKQNTNVKASVEAVKNTHEKLNVNQESLARTVHVSVHGQL